MYDVARPPAESKALKRDCDVLEKVEWRFSKFLFYFVLIFFFMYSFFPLLLPFFL